LASPSSLYTKCPICNELLPNPLPIKLSKLLSQIMIQGIYLKFFYSFLLNIIYSINYILFHIGIPKNVVNQHEFCRIHYNELNIVPHGIQRGYPLQIDFENLPQRIMNLRSHLIQIINNKCNSRYLKMAVDRAKEIGRVKASTTLIQMNYFELIQVSKFK